MEKRDTRPILDGGADGGFRILTPAHSTETAFDVYWVDLSSRYPIGSQIKRALDVAFAIVFILFAAPLLFLISAFIWIVSRGPAIYVQPRIGFRCEVFRMYKFRTMMLGAEEREAELKGGAAFFKLKDDPRVTRWGKFLRRYSLDELPQLFNVLGGSMSLVGPRPLLISDLDHYPLRNQMRRFSVKPGLTGLWQVSGRSSTTEDDRLALDKQYVNEWSLRLDLEILARTVRAVFSGGGAV